MKEGKLLIVDDNRGILSAVKLLADKHFAEVVTLASPNSLVSTLRTFKADVVLLDMNFSAGINSGNEGIYWLRPDSRQNIPRPKWCCSPHTPT